MVTPPEQEPHLVQFERGLVCRVLCPDEFARLGELTVKAGVVMEAELQNALTRDDVLLGQALVEAGVLDDQTLQRALVLQLLRRLERLFGLPVKTAWSFEAKVDAFEGLPPGVRIDTLRVLWAGITAHGEMGPWLEASLRRIGESPFKVRHDVNLRRFGFTGDARRLVRIVRRERVNLEELVARGVAPEEVCRQIVYLLAITRYLDFSPVGTVVDEQSSSDASVSVDELPSISDEPSTEDSISPDTIDPNKTLQAPPRRVARIALRRVAVARPGAAPDPPGSGDPSAAARDSSRRRSTARFNLMSEIQSRLVRLEHETPFALLDVDPTRLQGQDEDTITEILWDAYEVVAKRWHPDVCPQDLVELKEGMRKIHDAASEAFALLSDPETRALYLADVEQISSGDVPIRGRSSEAPSSSQAPVASQAPAASQAPSSSQAPAASKGARSSRAPLSSEPPISAPAPSSRESDGPVSSSQDPALPDETSGAIESEPPPSPQPVPEPPSSARSRAKRLAQTLPSAFEERAPAFEAREDEPVSGERAVEQVMASTVELHARALTALSEQHIDEALRLVRLACKADPDNPDYLASSAWIRAAQRKPELHVLLFDLDDLLDRHPGHATGRYYRAVIRRRVGNVDGARKDLEAVLDAAPDHEGARAELASLEKASARKG
ncbi:MAG: hypothetical protein KC731_18050 [Myxococcales bacterium]|nr:hypothetical protein [Myxococcales bacterium]